MTTNSNYYRFDPIFFQVPNAHYQIVALNASGSIIDNSDIIGTEQWGDLGCNLICEKVCNGKTYAYKITMTEHLITNPNNPLQPLVEPPLMMVEPAYKYYDATNALVVPYWQAFSYSHYAAIPPSHPYKGTTPGGVSGSEPVYDYRTEDISSLFGPGPYWDANNNQITNGKVIEKKFDQFKHFQWAFTAPTVPILESNCSWPLTGIGSSWVNMINDNASYNVIFPTVSNPFTGTIVHDLACFPSNGSATNGGSSVHYNWNEWIKDLYAQVADIEGNLGGPAINFNEWHNFADVFVSIGNIVSADNDFVTGLKIASLSNGNTGELTFGRQTLNENLELKEAVGDLGSGLYKFVIYTSTGDIIPAYINFSQELPSPDDKDFVKITVAPNPISNSLLKLNIKSKKAINCQVLVHDMNGVLRLSDNISLINGMNQNQEYQLQGNIPMNQLIVNFIFPDGSVIQKLVATI